MMSVRVAIFESQNNNASLHAVSAHQPSLSCEYQGVDEGHTKVHSGVYAFSSAAPKVLEQSAHLPERESVALHLSGLSSET